MMEKALFVSASLFCIGTELRFIANKHQAGPSSAEAMSMKKESEMWHAKAMHIAATFLPKQCPLVIHVISSYTKHHLKPKLETRSLQKISNETPASTQPSLNNNFNSNQQNFASTNSKAKKVEESIDKTPTQTVRKAAEL